MIISIIFSIQTESNVLASSTILYRSTDGNYFSKERMKIIIHNNEFEAVTRINEAGLDKPYDIVAKGEFRRQEGDLFSVNITEEQIGSLNFDTQDDVFIYNKYYDVRREPSLFKSVQIVEKLPDNYKLVLSNSPVKKIIAVKVIK